jgi:hypothetical protein
MRYLDAWASGPSGHAFGRSGSSPSPFDALSDSDLAGPEGSHPLAHIRIEDLVRPTTDHLSGSIEVDAPVRVGEGIRGIARITAVRDIDARGAAFRLVGLVMTEQDQSEEHRDSEGRVTSREDWVEARGRLFEELTFADVVLPRRLAAGQAIEVPFHIPAPRLGPPSGHAGCALVAWAVEARWDVAMGGDARMAALIPLQQHPDLLRAGVITVGAGAMHDVWTTPEGASISVDPPPPVVPGASLAMRVVWPGAPDGRSARLELVVDVEAPNGGQTVIATTPATIDALRNGADLALLLPDDLPPTLDADDVHVRYRIRAVVDIAFRPDSAVERLVVVT